MALHREESVGENSFEIRDDSSEQNNEAILVFQQDDDLLEKSDDYLKSIEIVHVANQGAATYDRFNLINQHLPHLKIISFPPSVYNYSIRPSPKKIMFLRSLGWQIEIKRINDSGERYQNYRPSSEKDYQEKHDLYREIFVFNRNPEKRRQLEELNDHGFINLDLMHEYFSHPKGISITDLATQNGIAPPTLLKEFRAIFHLMGFRFDDETIENKVNFLLRKLDKLKTEEQIQKQRKQLKEKFSVKQGEKAIYPPESLDEYYWLEWRDVYSLIVNHPQKWQALKSKHPRCYLAVTSFLGLEKFESTPMTLEEIGKQVFDGMSKQGVSYLKNRGLKLLRDLLPD